MIDSDSPLPYCLPGGDDGYYETFVKVGRLRVVGDLIMIEIDGDSVHEILVTDILVSFIN